MDQKDRVINRILEESRQGPVQMPKQELLAEMIRQIKKMPLNHDEVIGLYTAITGRMVWKRCSVCLKARLELEGQMVFPHGDLSRPKQFVCKDCGR